MLWLGCLFHCSWPLLLRPDRLCCGLWTTTTGSTRGAIPILTHAAAAAALAVSRAEKSVGFFHWLVLHQFALHCSARFSLLVSHGSRQENFKHNTGVGLKVFPNFRSGNCKLFSSFCHSILSIFLLEYSMWPSEQFVLISSHFGVPYGSRLLDE